MKWMGKGANYGYIEELLSSPEARLKSEPHARSGTRQDVFPLNTRVWDDQERKHER